MEDRVFFGVRVFVENEVVWVGSSRGSRVFIVCWYFFVKDVCGCVWSGFLKFLEGIGGFKKVGSGFMKLFYVNILFMVERIFVCLY